MKPILSSDTILDVSADGKYAILQKKDNEIYRIISKNIETGQEYEIASDWSEYIGLLPEREKRVRTGLTAGRKINLTVKKPVEKTNTQSTQPSQPNLSDCAVRQSKNLFPPNLVLNNNTYSKEGEIKYDDVYYQSGSDRIQFSVIRKEEKKEIFEALRTSIRRPAALGEGSERSSKNLYGEDTLFTIAKHTTGNYNWSIAVNISDQVIILFQGPVKPSKVEMSQIEELFNNWFQNVCSA